MAGSDEVGGPPHRAEPARPYDDARAEDAREALDVGMSLYNLALEYRFQERPVDARRVASQARRILENLPRTEILDQALAALRAFETPEGRAPE